MSEADLKRRIDKLERLLRQKTKPHRYQDKSHEVINKNPANVGSTEIKQGELTGYDDPDNDVRGIIFRINGKTVKVQGTDL